MLTENQQQQINNLESIQWSVALLGNISGIVYANKTGGGFWRYVGYAVVGGLMFGIPAALVITPFKNNILKQADKQE